MMTIVGFTNTQAPLPPPTAPYNANNNVALSSVNFMWGGAITDHIGAFAQVSYNAQPAGGFGSDPYGRSWTWDNTDVRYADSATVRRLQCCLRYHRQQQSDRPGSLEYHAGLGLPLRVVELGPDLGPTPIIDGGFAQNVVSAGAYAFINDLLYLETSVYTALSPNTQIGLGADPFDAPGLFDAAPYWRAAYEPHWGNNWLEVGTFRHVCADVHPWTMPGTTTTTTFPQTDKYTDIGFDTPISVSGRQLLGHAARQLYS